MQHIANIALYSCITNSYEAPKTLEHVEGIDCFLFTDQPHAKIPAPWHPLTASSVFADPRRNARFHKICAPLLFTPYDITIWIDGSVVLLAPPSVFLGALGDADVLTFTHPDRDCVYAEAAECTRLNLDYPSTMLSHINRLHAQGFPEHGGLAETKVVACRNTLRTQSFLQAWFTLLSMGSLRDQLSFPEAVQQTGVKVSYMPAISRGNPWFRAVKHVRTQYTESYAP